MYQCIDALLLKNDTQIALAALRYLLASRAEDKLREQVWL
jgi:hypothetical protein